MNPNEVIRDLTYPMKSITPMKKEKVLQTFGNRKAFSRPKKLKKEEIYKKKKKKVKDFMSFN